MKRKCKPESERRKPQAYGRGEGLTPLQPLDLRAVSSVSDLVAAMERTAFGGRTVGKAARLLEKMVRDPSMRVVLTLSGAMTVAKMGLVICEMIESGMVHAIVSTGALVCHGFVENAGMKHFEAPPESDASLYHKGYNRVYDTLELEANLDSVQGITEKAFGLYGEEEEIWTSQSTCRMLGRYLSETQPGRGILSVAYKHDVPIYIPAFSDSELGLELGIVNIKRERAGKTPLAFNPLLDLEHYARWILASERAGIFTIGGGVPRNWAQQIGPYLDVIADRIDPELGAFFRFHSGIRICPEPVHWGGLSGCTYAEGVSWGKFVPRSEGGDWVEVPADATIAWPLLIKAVLERLAQD